MKTVKEGTKATSATLQNAASSMPYNPFMGN